MKKLIRTREAMELLGLTTLQSVRTFARSHGISVKKTQRIGNLWISFEELAQHRPEILKTSGAVFPIYERPKKVIKVALSPDHAKKEIRLRYLRDAKAAINLGAGLPFEHRAALALLVDLMVLHENQGIPAEPSSYIAGMLGLGQRKWAQGIEPVLVESGRIRKVKRKGIEVYVWGDSSIFDGDKAVAILQPEQDSPPRGMDGMPAKGGAGRAPLDTQAPAPSPNHMRNEKLEEPTWWGSLHGSEEAPPSPPPAPEPKPEVIPAVTAIEILSSAGINVEDHPDGAFFWARREHSDVLDQWLKKLPANEIAARLARAVQQGQVTDQHPRNLDAFAPFIGL